MRCTTLLCGKPAEYICTQGGLGKTILKCKTCYTRSFHNDLVPITLMSNQAQHLRKKPLTRHELQELQPEPSDDGPDKEDRSCQCCGMPYFSTTKAGFCGMCASVCQAHDGKLVEQ